MRTGKSRVRRRKPPEKQPPFFGKDVAEKTSFFTSGKPLQRKTEISKPGDPQEKEAESAARQVMNQQVQKAEKKEEEKPVQKAEKKEEEKPVQKAEKKEEEKPVQKAEKKEEEKPVHKMEKKEEEKPVQKAEKKEEEKPVQAKRIQRMAKEQSAPAGENIQRAPEEATDDAAHPSLEERLTAQKGRGEPLDDPLREEMEKKFNWKFGMVRVHKDTAAAELCEELHALAFTHGYDIYFNEGQYNPNADGGKELLAHELAHVVQQNG